MNVISDHSFNTVSHRKIDAEGAGQRLDNFLLKTLKGLPKSRVYRIIRKGEVRINGKRAQPATRLASGDDVRIPPVGHLPLRSTAVGTFKNLEALILYQDESLLVLNKPAGMAVHGGSGIGVGVIESLRHILGEDLALVHRLDKGTSGCLMIARKRGYLRLLQQALRDTGVIGKEYLALVHGRWPDHTGFIDARLQTRATSSGGKTTRVIHAGAVSGNSPDSLTGKAALTRFSVIASEDDASLVKASPVTGRTHQIRVHALYARHPVLGDLRYGDEQRDRALSAWLGNRAGTPGASGPSAGQKIPRLMLHSQSLMIPALGGHPAVTVSAPMDQDMSRLIKQLFDIKRLSFA